jgi:predicted lipid carrier protein YhbT
MATITFDTLKFVERLEKAGVSREAQLATKNDLDKLEIRITSELNLVKWFSVSHY